MVVFTGAGISAESGLATFRDSGGLWNNYYFSEVATPYAWTTNPSFMLRFYKQRYEEVRACEPNEAHYAIAGLESNFEAIVLTQNIDDLHERAGSNAVLHLYGQIKYGRSSVDPLLVYPLCDRYIQEDDCCEKGGPMRPHVVWFGENIMYL